MIAVLAERSMLEQLQLADDLLARREIKKADVAIAKAIRAATDPQDRAECLIRRARARLLSARPDDALDDVNAAIALRNAPTEQPELLELAADAYLARFELATVGFADRNDVIQARALYQKILDNYPLYDNLGWVYYQMGRVFLADNRIAESAQYFHDGLFNASTNPALTAYCYERLAFANFYEARDLHRAYVFINKAIDTYPMNEERRWLVQVHVLRSRILRDMGRQAQALRAAETALQVAGSNNSSENKASLPEAYLTTGELLFEMDDRERDVISHLTQFTQLSRKPLGVDVTWSRVHEMLGDSYYKVGQYAAAANAYQGALQYNPYHPWETSLHYRIARSFYQQGDYERTIQALERMMSVAQSDGQPVTDYRVFDILGNALYALGRYQEALTAYRTALQMAPPNAVNLDKIRTYHDYAAEFCGETG